MPCVLHFAIAAAEVDEPHATSAPECGEARRYRGRAVQPPHGFASAKSGVAVTAMVDAAAIMAGSCGLEPIQLYEPDHVGQRRGPPLHFLRAALPPFLPSGGYVSPGQCVD